MRIEIDKIREGLLSFQEGSAAPEYEQGLLDALNIVEQHDIIFGEFRICPAYGDQEKCFSIYRLGGEGGDFNKDDFVKEVLAPFYKKHF